MEHKNLALVRRYLDAIEQCVSPEELASFFAPDVEQIEYPNRLVPAGANRNLEQLLEASTRGKQVLTKETYEIKSAIASDERVALEILWTGTLAIQLGAIPAGGSMTAHFAVFIEFENGRIRSQRNYDCFEAF